MMAKRPVQDSVMLPADGFCLFDDEQA